MTGFKNNWKLFIEQGKVCIKELSKKETRKKQVPNLLTASRLLSPFFIIPTALSGNLLLTGIFTGMFALTDAFDGYFARKYDAFSEFGRKLDPITDKIFACSLLIPIAFGNPFILINLLGEAVIAVTNIKAQINGKEPHTIFLGKLKTASLYITIALSYLSFGFNLNPFIANSLISVTAALQCLSSVKYNRKSNYQKVMLENIDDDIERNKNDDAEEKNDKINIKIKDSNTIDDWKNFKNEFLNINSSNSKQPEKLKIKTKEKQK